MTKLISLLDKHKYFIRMMQHEYSLYRYFGRLKWLGYVIYDCISLYVLSS